MIPLLVAAPIVAVGSPAVALDVDPSVQAGLQLPLNPVTGARYLELSTAPGYVGYDVHQFDEYDTPQMVIHRTGDGAPVRTVSWALDTNPPSLTAGGVVTSGPVPGQPGATRVTVTGLESADTQWTVDIPSTESYVSAGATWALSTLGSLGGGQAVLRRPGADPVPLPDVVLSAPDSAGPHVVANADTVAIHNNSTIWTVDLASGTVHQVTTAAGDYEPMILTPHRVFWVAQGTPTSAHVYWSDVDGSAPGDVAVADTTGTGGWVGFGDRVAALQSEPGDELYRVHLEPLDLATGTRQQSVAADVAAARSLGDGSVALALFDTPSGRVVTVADDGQPAHPVADLPAIGQQVSALGLSDGRVAAWFGSAYSPGTGAVLSAPADGLGGWSPTLAAGDDPMSGSLVAARGDVVLTDAEGAYSYSPHEFTVRWPGGHRDVGQNGTLVLGRGGKVLVSAPDPSTVAFDDVRTGNRLETIAAGLPVAVDGWTLWRGPDPAGNLVATDLSSAGGSERTVATGLTPCDYSHDQFSYPDLQVAGRFALIDCRSTFTAIDLDGVLAPQRIPWSGGYGTQFPQLGNGFVAWVHRTTDPSGTIYAVAQVQNLGTGGGTRLYGPLHGYFSLPDSMMAVDDGDNPRLAYADTTVLPRVVDLAGLTPAPATWHDATAPTLTSMTGGRWVAAGPVAAAWSFTDSTDAAGELPSQVASYDVRYQQGPIGGPYGAWVQPAALQATTSTTTELAAGAGTDTCFSVRARDRAGNVSTWSASRCSAVDSGAPVLQSTGGTPRVNPERQVSFAWSFTDPSGGVGLPGSGTASYDVRYQQAPSVGTAYGAWVSPSAWDHTGATSVTLQALTPGTDTCFQVRARDNAGNLSPWSANRCSAVDGTAPHMTTANAGPLVVARTTSTPVAFSYKGSDNLAVASYDVGYRYAAPGGALGALQRPASWQGTTSTVQHLSVPAGGEVCFTARARDRVGLLSPWAAYRCATVPYDDRALAGRSVSRLTSRLALSGTVSRLNVAGATLTTGHKTGRYVALVVLRGPHQGAVDLYVGSRRITRVGLSVATWHRDVVLVPTGTFTNATVTIRSVTAATSLIDALAIVR